MEHRPGPEFCRPKFFSFPSKESNNHIFEIHSQLIPSIPRTIMDVTNQTYSSKGPCTILSLPESPEANCPWGMKIWDLQELDEEIIAIPIMSFSSFDDDPKSTPPRTPSARSNFRGMCKLSDGKITTESRNYEPADTVSKLRRKVSAKRISWSL
jgi:hypothetical protein